MATSFQSWQKGLPELFSRLRDDSGAFMIEMACGFMILMTMVIGIMECSMMAYAYTIVEESAREGVRYASTHGSDSGTCQGPSTGCDSGAAAVIADVKRYATGFSGTLSNMTVTVNYPDGTSTGTSRVQVIVTDVYSPIFKFPGSTHTLSASSEGRIMY
jgi:Flp pilus assembly protein TadG